MGLLIFNPERKKSFNDCNAWLISLEFSPGEKVHGEDFSGGRRYSASVVFRERHQGLWLQDWRRWGSHGSDVERQVAVVEVERLEGGAEGVLMIGSQGHRCLKQRKVRRSKREGREEQS